MGNKVSLYHLLRLYTTEPLRLCVDDPSLSGERGPGSSGAPRVHVCTPAVMSCIAGSSYSCRVRQVLSFCLAGPRLPDPRPWCWAPYHPDSRFPQQCALAIARVCFKKATMFSSMGDSSVRDGDVRNSSSSQQSGDITVVISLNFMFTSGMGFQS